MKGNRDVSVPITIFSFALLVKEFFGIPCKKVVDVHPGRTGRLKVTPTH